MKEEDHWVGEDGRVLLRPAIADAAATTRPDLIGRDFGIDPDRPSPLNARWCG